MSETFENRDMAGSVFHARTREVVARITPEELRRDTGDIDFGQGTVGGVLQGMARHDLEHIRQAEATLGVSRSWHGTG